MSTKRQTDGAGQGTGAKKQKFDTLNPSTLAYDEADDEDTILDLDETLSKGKGRQLKRTGVRIDGYDSDSSTDNFDARAEAKEKAAAGPVKGSLAEEDNDMFADVDQDMADGGGIDTARDVKTSRGNGKQVQFMDAADIAGQIDTSRSGGHVRVDFGPGAENEKGTTTGDVESSSESGDDSDRAALDPELEDADELGAGSKKRHAPKLDAFNLKRETEEEGLFDAAGNFVRKAADADAKHDVWMAGLSKRDLRRAREAHEKRERESRRSHAENDSVLTSELLDKLITRLSKTETPLEALQRLGSGDTEKKKQQQRRAASKNRRAKREDAMEVDGDTNNAPAEGEDPAEMRRKQAVEAITDSADKLLSRGQVDIYDTERELLVRQYRRETGEDWRDRGRDRDGDQGKGERERGADASVTDGGGDLAEKQWEYRWADGRDGGERHGPYHGSMMDAWLKAGYFGQDVEYRAVGETGWRRDVDFT